MHDGYQIFISYRRADSWGWAGRIYDHLCEGFGKERVFMDVEEIDAGTRFVERILEVVSRSKVILIIVGTRWLAEIASDGRRRIDQDDDLVRLEIEKALFARVDILPVLVEGASMPLKETLPSTISQVCEINAQELQPKTFRRDLEELRESIRRILERADDEEKALPEQIARLERERREIDERLGALQKRQREQIVAADQSFQSEIAQGRPTVDRLGVVERPYDAFLLYSHQDERVASALQAGLERFARPSYRMRSIRVFRDQANLAASPDLWSDITAALERSKYVVLVASPASAGSPWVSRELGYWLRHRSIEEVLVVNLGGELVWDGITNDFDWTRTTALPNVLRGAFRSEPLWVDLRWAKADSSVSLDDSMFQSVVASLSAAILGVSKDVLLEKERRALKRRGVIMATATAIGVFAIALIALAFTIAKLGAR